VYHASASSRSGRSLWDSLYDTASCCLGHQAFIAGSGRIKACDIPLQLTIDLEVSHHHSSSSTTGRTSHHHPFRHRSAWYPRLMARTSRNPLPGDWRFRRLVFGLRDRLPSFPLVPHQERTDRYRSTDGPTGGLEQERSKHVGVGLGRSQRGDELQYRPLPR
jgi:hypothetical protein